MVPSNVRFPAVLAAACLLHGVSLKAADVVTAPREISGIVVHADVEQPDAPVIFSIVTDETPAAYFKNYTKWLPAPGQTRPFPPKALRRTLSKAVVSTATDIEDIGVLNDRIVVLSEDATALFDDAGLLLDYSAVAGLRPVDYAPNKGSEEYGVEGLAVRTVADDEFEIALLWEGGRDPIRGPMSPRLFRHRVTVSELRNRPLKVSGESGTLTEISYNRLVELTGLPTGIVFRTPAVVWNDVDPEPGWLILLSVNDRTAYHRKWLLHVTADGSTVTAATPLQAFGLADDVVHHNWEGMCWNADHTALILVNDAHRPADPTLLLTIAYQRP